MSSGTAWPARRPVITGWLALLLLVGGFGAWAATARLSGAIIAPGRVAVVPTRQVVQHPDGGVVAALLVAEGERVAPGEVLLRLDDATLRAQLKQVETRLFEVMARRARLTAERDGTTRIAFDPELLKRAEDRPALTDVMAGQRRLMQARATLLAQELAQLRVRRDQMAKAMAGITAQQSALKRQLTLIRHELTAQQSLLDRGLAQGARVLSLRREEARLRGAMGELTARYAEAADRAAGIGIEVLRLKAAHRGKAITQLRDVQTRELELSGERDALLQRLARLEVTAPLAGVVHDLRVPGAQAVVRPAAPILSIVPRDRAPVVHAHIAPTDIDALHVGQPATLRFPHMDQGVTPRAEGHITRVSADILHDPNQGRAYYRAEITLHPGALGALPRGTSLIPGMPVETFIRTGDHRPAAYLVRPIADYFTRAFRQ